jgi:hypothetical protein
MCMSLSSPRYPRHFLLDIHCATCPAAQPAGSCTLQHRNRYGVQDITGSWWFLQHQTDNFYSLSRPGILVLINDADWELEGEASYALQPRDNILFVSTLHGG